MEISAALWAHAAREKLYFTYLLQNYCTVRIAKKYKRMCIRKTGKNELSQNTVHMPTIIASNLYLLIYYSTYSIYGRYVSIRN